MKDLILISVMLFSTSSFANVVGVDTQNFNPTSNGIDFVTVQSSETLKPGIFNLGLFLNYAVNTLPNYQDSNTQSLQSPKDQLFSMDLSIGLGLLKDWDIGLTVPQVLNQSLDEDNSTFRGFFETTGVTEIRANSKYKLFGNALYGLAVVGSVNFYLIEDNPFTGTDPGPTINLELAGNYTLGKVNLGANIGYRFRNPGTPVPAIPVEPYPDEVIASVAASYLISSWDTKIIGEVVSSFPTENVEFTSDRDISTAEFIAGFKWSASHAVALHLGAGAEIIHGSASPDFRVYSGINWNFGPLFGKTFTSSDLAPLPSPSVAVAKPTRRVVYLDEVDFTQVPKKEETFVAKDVLFAFNSARVNANFYPILKKLAGYLERNGGFRSLIIEGHTDSIGTDSYNFNLSQKRATAVREALNGYLNRRNHSKVRALGKGERQPVADNGNYQGRALNRRVEFKIYR